MAFAPQRHTLGMSSGPNPPARISRRHRYTAIAHGPLARTDDAQAYLGHCTSYDQPLPIVELASVYR